MIRKALVALVVGAAFAAAPPASAAVSSHGSHGSRSAPPVIATPHVKASIDYGAGDWDAYQKALAKAGSTHEAVPV